MNKIILLSDKEELPKGAFDFACMLQEQQPILLTGVFLPKTDYWDSLLYASYGIATPIPFYPEEIVPVAQNAIPKFRKLCEGNGIDYRIHDKEYEDIRKELRTETRFADLVLFSNEAFYNSLDAIVSEEYTNHTLRHSECPVVCVPEEFTKPESNILAYDGSASSVYAIRQFASLMPELCKLETLLVYVNPNAHHDFPERDLLEELVARHYPNLTLTKLDIDPKKYFGTWLANRRNTMLVTGAHSKSGIAEVFHKSFVSDILRDHLLPVFIAHR